jgi:hypothetical protein
MPALNVVRFRVRPGMDQVFLDAHRHHRAAWPGLTRGRIVAAGDRSFVLVGEWPDMAALGSARAPMIETLNSFRHALEDLGPGLGVTDAISGDVVLALTSPEA